MRIHVYNNESIYESVCLFKNITVLKFSNMFV